MAGGNKDDFVKILRALAKPGDPVIVKVMRDQVFKKKTVLEEMLPRKLALIDVEQEIAWLEAMWECLDAIS